MSQDELLLADADGQMYRVPRSVVAPYARPAGEIQALIAKVDRLDLEKADVPADLREAWRQAQAEQPEAEGQMAGIAGLILAIRLALLAYRIVQATAKKTA
jgi:hypothetical protein